MIAAGWGQILRGWGEGTGREFSLRGGDGEEMLNLCHSLLHTRNEKLEIFMNQIWFFVFVEAEKKKKK